jgi:hypothetical protein
VNGHVYPQMLPLKGFALYHPPAGKMAGLSGANRQLSLAPLYHPYTEWQTLSGGTGNFFFTLIVLRSTNVFCYPDQLACRIGGWLTP